MYGSYLGYGNVGRFGSRWCGFLGTDWWSRGLMIALVLIGIALIVLLAVSLSKRSSQGRSTSDEALSIVNKRYANGEIDSETYEKMKRDLR